MWSVSDGIDVAGHLYPNGATEAERYSNYMQAIRTVFVLRRVYAPSARMWIEILFGSSAGSARPRPRAAAAAAAAAPAGSARLRLTDPRGRRTGYDPAGGGSLQEDRTTFASEFTSFADPLGTLPEAAPSRSITANEPEAGTYALEVFGTASGPFTLKLANVAGDEMQGATTIAGSIAAGETKRYELVRSDSGALSATAVTAFAPHARAGNDAYGYTSRPVSFDGRGSNQPAGTIASYAWDFGDGATASGAQQDHAYATPGIYAATLTVTNAAARTATDTRLVTIAAAPVHPKETVRVNVSGTGEEANSATWQSPDVSPDGRFVAFSSSANNLVAGDANGVADVFVKDRSTGAVELASVSSAEAQSDADSYTPSISADGRFVAFYCSASNLGAATSGYYVRDRQAGETSFVARADYGAVPSISDDGRYVGFATAHVIAPDADAPSRVYVYDRQTATFDHVGAGRDAQLSGDGAFVVFSGFDLASPSSYFGVLVHDRMAQTTEVASLSALGQPLANAGHASISADGRYVAFDVNNNGALGAPPPPFDKPDVLLRDRQLDTTEQVNTGFADDGPSIMPAVSPTGTLRRVRQRAQPQRQHDVPALRARPRAGHARAGERRERRDARRSPVRLSGRPHVGRRRRLLVVLREPRRRRHERGLGHLHAQAAAARRRRSRHAAGEPRWPVRGLGVDRGGARRDPPRRQRVARSPAADADGAVGLRRRLAGGRRRPRDLARLRRARRLRGDADGARRDRHVGGGAHRGPGAAGAAARRPDRLRVCSGRRDAVDRGVATVSNAQLVARGWDTSGGPPSLAPVTIVLPWGQTQARRRSRA